MAKVSIAIEQFRTESLVHAMFPEAVEAGNVDIGEMMRQCQYRAAAILEFSVSELHSTPLNVRYFDMIQAAKGYISAANALVDEVLAGDAK